MVFFVALLANNNLMLCFQDCQFTKLKDDTALHVVFQGNRDLKILWTRPRRTSTGTEKFNSRNN